MFVLDRLTRVSAEEVSCCINLDGKPLEVVIRIEQHGTIRLFNLGDRLSRELRWQLSNCNQFRAFLKTVWAFVDGESVTLPREIVSDWPTDDGMQPGGQ